MPKLSAFLVELRKLALALLQSTVIAAPGKDTVGSGDRMGREGPDDDQRQRRHGRPTDQSQGVSCASHDVTRRITKDSQTQVKRMIWWAKRG